MVVAAAFILFYSSPVLSASFCFYRIFLAHMAQSSVEIEPASTQPLTEDGTQPFERQLEAAFVFSCVPIPYDVTRAVTRYFWLLSQRDERDKLTLLYAQCLDNRECLLFNGSHKLSPGRVTMVWEYIVAKLRCIHLSLLRQKADLDRIVDLSVMAHWKSEQSWAATRHYGKELLQRWCVNAIDIFVSWAMACGNRRAALFCFRFRGALNRDVEKIDALFSVMFPVKEKMYAQSTGINLASPLLRTNQTYSLCLHETLHCLIRQKHFAAAQRVLWIIIAGANPEQQRSYNVQVARDFAAHMYAVRNDPLWDFSAVGV
jgi:hypothetical protein